jgi:hypothetical protein
MKSSINRVSKNKLIINKPKYVEQLKPNRINRQNAVKISQFISKRIKLIFSFLE